MSATAPTVSPITVAHEAQNALSAVRLRLHLMRQRFEHGDIDLARILIDVADLEENLQQGIDLIGTLQVRVIHAVDGITPTPLMDD